MKIERNIDKTEKPALRLCAFMQRLIIHSMIVLAYYHICNTLLEDNGWLDVLYAICFSGNAFLLPDYTRWITNKNT